MAMRTLFDWDPAQAATCRLGQALARPNGLEPRCWVATVGAALTQPTRRVTLISQTNAKDGNMNNSPDKRDDDMKDDYDFTGGVRGKFFRAGAALVPPVHLEPDVLAYLQARATARGTSLSALVNDLLKHDIALIETGR